MCSKCARAAAVVGDDGPIIVRGPRPVVLNVTIGSTEVADPSNGHGGFLVRQGGTLAAFHRRPVPWARRCQDVAEPADEVRRRAAHGGPSPKRGRCRWPRSHRPSRLGSGISVGHGSAPRRSNRLRIAVPKVRPARAGAVERWPAVDGHEVAVGRTGRRGCRARPSLTEAQIEAGSRSPGRRDMPPLPEPMVRLRRSRPAHPGDPGLHHRSSAAGRPRAPAASPRPARGFDLDRGRGNHGPSSLSPVRPSRAPATRSVTSATSPIPSTRPRCRLMM